MIQLTFYDQNSDWKKLSLSKIFPYTPLSTEEYLNAQSSASKQFSLVVGESDGKPVAAIMLHISRLRLEKRALANVLAVHKECAFSFWKELISYLRDKHIDNLKILTFCAETFSQPDINGIILAKERWEYHIQLRKFGMETLHSKHRNMVRKAQKANILFSCSTNHHDLAHHLNMRRFSMQKRLDRGDRVDLPTDNLILKEMLECGAGELFLAIHYGEVVSSAFVLKFTKGGYLHSAGTNSKGMTLGASNLLIYNVLRTFKERGLCRFNLGGVTADESGLRLFKERFGGQRVYKPEFSIIIQKRFLPTLHRVIRTFLHNPLEWFRIYLLAKVGYVVFRASPNALPIAVIPKGYEIRPLSDEELERCKGSEYDKAFRKYKCYGTFDGAHGCWVDGELAHISWVVNKQLERTYEERNVGLKKNELEITHCYTGEMFRGKGIYTSMIRYLSEHAINQDCKWIYMITSINNTASRRGIIKAGLKEISRIVRYSPLPPLRMGFSLVVRGHRKFHNRFALCRKVR